MRNGEQFPLLSWLCFVYETVMKNATMRNTDNVEVRSSSLRSPTIRLVRRYAVRLSRRPPHIHITITIK